MTSNIELKGGLKCPHKIQFNKQCPPRIFRPSYGPVQCHDWPSIKVDLVSNWLGLDVISKVITLSFSRSVPATRTIVLSVCATAVYFEGKLKVEKAATATLLSPASRPLTILLPTHNGSKSILKRNMPLNLQSRPWCNRHLTVLSYILRGQNERSLELPSQLKPNLSTPLHFRKDRFFNFSTILVWFIFS